MGRSAFRAPAEERQSQPLAVDLFAGAGGATLGMERAGLRVVAAVEIDRDACATYRANHPEVHLMEGDICTVDPAPLAEEAAFGRGQLALLKACAPCQGFSTLGHSALDDERNDLVLETWRFISAWRPASFVFENVPGIRHDDRLRRVLRQARAIGYGVRTYLVDAVEFGVPQRRRRHVVVGVRSKAQSELPGSLPRKPTSVTDYTTVGHAFQRLVSSQDDQLNRHRKSRATTLQRIRAVPVGGSRFDLPDELVLSCHKALTRTAAFGPYSRMCADQPAPTLTTRCTTPACGQFVHPTADRGITLREAAVLQSFPSDYNFVGGYDSVERQIGNAVPAPMAEGICAATLELVEATG
ncbi:MAG: DNA cytosine methyltransferase [Acidimicrobiia bacterium]